MRFSLVLFLTGLFCTGFSQKDTTGAWKNVDTVAFYIDSAGLINQKPTKDVGNEIPHLVIYNEANNNVLIELSTNKQNWSEFALNPKSKKIIRCEYPFQKMFIKIDPAALYPTKAVIYKGLEYKIFYDDHLKIYDIKEY